MGLFKGLLLKPTLNLLNWMLRSNGNSIIIGGPLGWSWYSTIDTTHHGALAGPANAHRHGDLANIGVDDHHTQDHAARHQNDGADEISVAGLSGELANRQKSKVGSSTLGWTANKLLKGAGVGANPTEIDVPISAIISRLPSEDLRNSNDTEKYTTSSSYVKLKEVKLNANLAACRIKFDLRCSDGGYDAYARIYKNGSPIGTERRVLVTGWTTFSEDFSGFVTNDLIQIYVKSYYGPPYQARVRNMRFYYTFYVNKFGDDTLVTALELTTDPTISMTNQDP